MSRMKEYLNELEHDFERLSTTSMEWNAKIWADQVEEGRFAINHSDWSYTYIHWFDNYAAVIAAKNILREMDEDFKVVSDEVSGDWVILTSYTSNVWKGL